MKAICVYYNKNTYVGPIIFFILQGGIHAWAYNEVYQNIYILGPFCFLAILFFFIVRLKNPGIIPILKADIPIENNHVEVHIENDVNREILNAQANDESNVQISLDQFKDGNDNDNTVQKYIPETKEKQKDKMNNVNDINIDHSEKHQPNTTETKLIFSGREMLYSPSSEQVKMQQISNKQTCISTGNAVSPQVLATERRFCMQCLNDQPMRAKHCQYCKKCIPTFDHHCPWIGVCIGEKNKIFFFCYLIIQISQLSIGIQLLIHNIAIIVIIGIIVLLLISLALFHVFYISKNITTWEFLSWKRITYISQQHRYPFDKGVFQNWKLFLQVSCKTQIHEWQIPQ